MTTKYDNDDWEDLPVEIRKAYETLGYTEDIWEADGNPPSEDKDWKELSADEQAAAKKLGYKEKSWNAS